MKNGLQRQPATPMTGESKLLAPDTQESGGHSPETIKQPVSSEATREGLVPESHLPEPELTKVSLFFESATS
jgi:hypothetical protein